MCKSSFNVFKGVIWLLWGAVVVVFLIIVVEVNEVGIVVIASLPLWTVAGEVSLLPTLETCIVSHVSRWPLSVGHISSGGVSSSPTSPIVWSMGSVEVHWDRLIVHPPWCIGGVVLGLLLSLSSSLSKLLVTVPSSSSVLGEEWAIWCISSSKCCKVQRRISSISTVLRRVIASLRRDDGVE